MLKLRGVCKSYFEGKNKRVVLNNIDIDFKKRELVFILGKSGSGKSTLLNIIGGNLRCDSGEIYLDNALVSKFDDKLLSDYRGSIIGNVFQDYNLIDYMDVISNVNLGSTGMSSLKRTSILLKQLGLFSKRNVRVSKLSGGEKQRVAIARAMIKDPEILLCDEPTGALDSENSVMIMDILKKISLNKLVIVVSHDVDLANRYADRIIYLKDGKTEYVKQIDSNVMGEIKRGGIKSGNIFKMAVKNLWLKKGRTILSSLAISLGLISMILVVLLANNFNKELSDLEEELVRVIPVKISNGKYLMDNKGKGDNKKIILKREEDYIYNNKITRGDIEFLKGIKEIKAITYNYLISMPIVSDRYKLMDDEYFSVINGVDKDRYEVIKGRMPSSEFEIVLKVDNNVMVYDQLVKPFLIENDIENDDIIGRRVRVILNDSYYGEEDGHFVLLDNYQEMYDKSDIELTVVGVIKSKDEEVDNSLFYYDERLINFIIDRNKDSLIIKRQLESDKVLLMGIAGDRDEVLNYLGYNSLPMEIGLYFDSIKDKENALGKIDNYSHRLIYVDEMASSIKIVKEFMLIVSGVLIVFSVIALGVSSIMILLMTSVRVRERKKEIGILRSLGARKRDIRKLFNIENILIGGMAFLISLVVVVVLERPINVFMDSALGLDNIFKINYGLVFLIGLGNILLVMAAGYIPSRRASNMEIVSCIYNR